MPFQFSVQSAQGGDANDGLMPAVCAQAGGGLLVALKRSQWN